MSLQNYNKHSFGKALNKFVSPSQPIHSIENLFGRDDELERIEKALFAAGRHIFIFGDRGVGKSSLAATAANQYQSSDAEYIDISCSPDSTLRDIVANIAYQATNTSRLVETINKISGGLEFKYLKLLIDKELSAKDLSQEIKTTTDATAVLKEISKTHSQNPIIVIDEFDRIVSDHERSLFADLIKQIGDKRIDIKFIFTGVAKTLDSLLGAHQSAIRQLETIELPKLSWDGRWEIARHIAKQFDLFIDREILIRIAAVSDGYPYYIHLITEKLLWRVFESDSDETVTWDHYHLAIKDSIQSISAELKRPYELAINQRSNDFEEVLWATADSEWLHRHIKDMYSSYEHIAKQRKSRNKLDYKSFSDRVRSLKRESHGEILIPDTHKKGMYSYREKMLRGYVRMQAEANGVELIGENIAEEKQKSHATVRTSSGYHQSKVPPGVSFKRGRY
ncbi:AAA family ATPase [Pseudomonas aeruginosa]|uniref:AAA family ATPase n=1 Tax=Pseudomonas aeruginosa TaxID=287 RepID=UPI000F54A9DC|nr:ATP-binding protein [Pseudomonas aeruginosa]MBG5300279.1 ATP-binding protein [Pseudomonas aeruginosa]MDI3796799.1 ATP-binding protein [Pseudomonas aeruginosa]RPX29078.1 ATP-binding protein [Pseudomonas aeruginosa]WCV83210.1 ATP-binding protein [Pseudomonas aeruginosa]HBP5035302.1 ATP-binding protein [Pseudomonas aeruginosa]